MAIAEPQTGLSDGWVWAPRIDPNCGEYGLFVNQDNSVQIDQGDETAALTGMRVVLNNHFAPMPVCGHGYASAQFIGRGSTEFSVQITGIGDQKLSEIQSMHEKLEQNARLFRRFEGAARVRFQGNEFLRLTGIDDGIITSIDTTTSSDGTNLYECQISFTSDGHHTEGFEQEMYVDSGIAGDVLDVLLNRVNVRVISPEETAALESDDNFEHIIRTTMSSPAGDLGQAVAGDIGESVLGTGGDLAGAATAWYLSYLRSSLRAQGYDRASNLTSVDGLLEAARVETDLGLQRLGDWWSGGSERVEQQETRGAYLRFPIRTPVPAATDDTAVYTPLSEPDHPWVLRYVQQVCDLFHQWARNLPGLAFFRGPARGKYLNYHNRAPVSENEGDGVRTEWEPEVGNISNWPPMLGNASSTLSGMIHGRRRRWLSVRSSTVTGRNSIETNLLEFEQQLMSIAQNVLAEAQAEEGFNDLFSGITERYIDAPRQSAHPTYPDLELPPHPATGLVIDTEPDFYYFNDGEEGLLNEVGPELVEEMDFRLQNMENTYTRLSSGQEWSETYLGRSRVAVADEAIDGSLDDRYRYRGLDGGTGLSIDNMTVDNAANWGPDNGRTIGGESEGNDFSVIQAALNMSPTVRSSHSDDSQVLRERRLGMMRATSFSLPQGDPQGALGIGPIDSALDQSDRSHSFSRNAMRTVIQQSVAQAPEETLTMRRAFPSFKIYFIEDDTGAMREHLLPSGGSSSAVRPIMFFDDLYNYNSVKNIRLIRSRKNPADILVLQLTNVQGLLERRRWVSPNERQRELYAPGFEETEMENPLKKIIMKEGLKVQARLGNTNNPHKMGVKFIGEVVEYSYNADVSDEVTIICQSYGSELTLEKKSVTEETQVNFIDTPDIVHTLMCSPELVHFGRFDLNPQFNPGEARTAATSRSDPSTGTEGGTGRLVRNPREVIQGLQEELAINRSKWLLGNNPSDDNIFAPGVRDHLSSWERFTDDVGAQAMWGSEWITGLSEAMDSTALHIFSLGGSLVGSTVLGWAGSGLRSLGEWMNDGGMTLTGQTIWETLKECELRHPGWIAHPRPYGTRMTMFFGVPSHRYWADEIGREEMLVLQRLRAASEEVWRSSPDGQLAQAAMSVARGEVSNGIGTPIQEIGTLGAAAQAVYLRTCHQMAANRWLADGGEYIASTLGRFRPFRRYHLLTSDHHILMNNIRASKKGTFNAVNLQYGDGQIYTLKADDSIPDELTRVQGFNYPSCDNETLARRYCIGLLNRHLKDVYKGEVVVTGMDVDPYDLCYLHDDRVGMYGSFEIEQVVDTFTPETGWITEITPDMITGTNEWSTRSTAEARTAVLGTLSQRYMGARLDTTGAGVIAAAATGATSALSPIAGAVVGAGAMLAWLGGYHIVRWTQDRQPIWVCPLILGERPFFAGLDGFRQDGLFASIRGELNAEFDAVSEGWRRFHLAGYANDIVVGITRSLAGQG